jgi:hypothetical protein
MERMASGIEKVTEADHKPEAEYKFRLVPNHWLKLQFEKKTAQYSELSQHLGVSQLRFWLLSLGVNRLGLLKFNLNRNHKSTM